MVDLEQGVKPGERTPRPRGGRHASISHTGRKCQGFFRMGVVFGPRRPFVHVGRKSGCGTEENAVSPRRSRKRAIAPQGEAASSAQTRSGGPAKSQLPHADLAAEVT